MRTPSPRQGPRIARRHLLKRLQPRQAPPPPCRSPSQRLPPRRQGNRQPCRRPRNPTRLLSLLQHPSPPASARPPLALPALRPTSTSSRRVTATVGARRKRRLCSRPCLPRCRRRSRRWSGPRLRRRSLWGCRGRTHERKPSMNNSTPLLLHSLDSNCSVWPISSATSRPTQRAFAKCGLWSISRTLSPPLSSLTSTPLAPPRAASRATTMRSAAPPRCCPFQRRRTHGRRRSG
mmetsp:Transcript_2847/g.6980  ORF Transcript_2847/g.6980 Transcript_2847/m.6980 type:complete len:234 (+) Transcript_2847:861-1562(+)